MSLNFIDIASWQAGISLDKVFAENPLNGVIVKATQSTGYVNPYCDQWVQWLIKNGKPWGFYHFLDGHDPVAEAKYFVQNTLNYWGDGVPVADYEGSVVSSYGTYYLRKFLEECYAETGIKPLIYCNLSTVQSDVNGFRTLADEGYKLWLAQYASMNDQRGFLEHPWQKGSYAPFKEITMHQYTSCGILNGYSGRLDFDIFYGTQEDWTALAGKEESAPEPEPSEDPDLSKVVGLLRQALNILMEYMLKH